MLESDCWLRLIGVKSDMRVHEAPLQVGQLVYLWDHSARGRHKIQDVWSSAVYEIPRAPSNAGAVYTIAPIDDLHKVRTVHHDMLKAQVGSEPLGHPPSAPSPLVPAASGDDEDGDHSSNFLDDGDLCLLVPHTSLLSIVAASGPSGSAAPFSPWWELNHYQISLWSSDVPARHCHLEPH